MMFRSHPAATYVKLRVVTSNLAGHSQLFVIAVIAVGAVVKLVCTVDPFQATNTFLQLHKIVTTVWCALDGVRVICHLSSTPAVQCSAHEASANRRLPHFIVLQSKQP